ncbi:MAG: hypothetical protein IT186_14275 [Acidobacteria bacterium]|nr:hypothetical protein [Acidobacteriota bacterium]MCK6682855.1 hypothetical protein [Thermoanaerobaculia bacterium]
MAELIAVDHHSQGFLVALLLLGCLVAHTFLPAMLALPYLAMHITYSGSGSFQRPLRVTTPASWLDVLLVGLGVLSAIASVSTMAFSLLLRFLG